MSKIAIPKNILIVVAFKRGKAFRQSQRQPVTSRYFMTFFILCCCKGFVEGDEQASGFTSRTRHENMAYLSKLAGVRSIALCAPVV